MKNAGIFVAWALGAVGALLLGGVAFAGECRVPNIKEIETQIRSDQSLDRQTIEQRVRDEKNVVFVRILLCSARGEKISSDDVDFAERELRWSIDEEVFGLYQDLQLAEFAFQNGQLSASELRSVRAEIEADIELAKTKADGLINKLRSLRK